MGHIPWAVHHGPYIMGHAPWAMHRGPQVPSDKPRVLLMYPGHRRPGGPDDQLEALGYCVVGIDEVRGHDVSEGELAATLIDHAQRGAFVACQQGLPCDSYAIVRAAGPRSCQLRTWEHPHGNPLTLTVGQKAYLRLHNLLLDITLAILEAMARLDRPGLLENGASRHIRGTDYYWPARAGMPQVWSMAQFLATARRLGSRMTLVTGPQCAFGPGPHGLFQAWTTLACVGEARQRMAEFGSMPCLHPLGHGQVAAGYDEHGNSMAGKKAEYSNAFWAAQVFALTGEYAPKRLRKSVTWADEAGAALWAMEPNPPEQQQEWSRATKAGRVADGPALAEPICERIHRARYDAPPWASFRYRKAASSEEREVAPMPVGNVPQTTEADVADPLAWTDEQCLDFARLQLGRNVEPADLWPPGVYQEQLDWLQAASDGRPPARRTWPDVQRVWWAQRRVWDQRDPTDVRPVVRSDRDTVFAPGGAGQLDRAAFRAMAQEVGCQDARLLATVGEGGMESGSTCALDTVFCGHHPGFYDNEAFGEAALAKERDSHWADHSHCHPPFSPTHMVPRDVVNTVKGKVLLAGTMRADGSVVLADEVVRIPKGRITLDPSTGDESPNDGIPPERRTTVLPTVRGTGQAIAVVGQAASAAGERAVIVGIDDSSAYCYIQQQRSEWWFNAYLARRADRKAVIGFLTRMGFGGAHSTQCYQGVGTVATLAMRKRFREFDEAHPLPEGIQLWSAKRRKLQELGQLPPGPEQSSPDFASSFVDDTQIVATSDVVQCTGPCCESHRMVHLGADATRSVGGVPMHRDSRAARKLGVAVEVKTELGLLVAQEKTEGGSAAVSLGLLLDVTRDRIRCPAGKRAIMLQDIDAQSEAILTNGVVDREQAEEMTGRLGNLAQIIPELLPFMHGGHRVANAAFTDGKGRRHQLASVRLGAATPARRQYLGLLRVARRLVDSNEGVPMSAPAVFPGPEEAHVWTSTTDASGNDGMGGYVFRPHEPDHAWLVSEKWPPDVLAALLNAAKKLAERDPGTPLLSMPAAELFTCWAVPAAVAGACRCTPAAVLAVGDCDPAAKAINSATSGVPQIAHILGAMRRTSSQWLGVHVNREWNLDADRLSHPRMLGGVRADAEAGGVRTSVACVPNALWDELRRAMLIPGGDAVFGGGSLGVVDTGSETGTELP